MIFAAVAVTLTWPLLFFGAVGGCVLLAAGWSAGRDRALGVALAGVVGAVILVPAVSESLPAFTGQAVGLAWSLLFILRAGRRPVPVHASGALLVAVLALGIVSAAFGPSSGWLPTLIALYLIWAVLLASQCTDAEVRLVAGVVVGLAVVVALMAAYEMLRGDLLLPGVQRRPHPLLAGAARGVATTGHPLIAGFLCVVGLGLALASRRPFLQRWALGAVLAVGVFASGSTSMYVAAAAVLVVHLTFGGRRRPHPMRVLLVGGLLAALYVNQDALTRVAADIGGANAEHRLNSVRSIPHLFFDRPVGQATFGTGWGSAEFNYQAGYLVNDGFFAVDNQITTLVMAVGVVGLALFAWAVLKGLRSLPGWAAPACPRRPGQYQPGCGRESASGPATGAR